tara:strand:+ start:251 stop:364 length:114 start_codon:yes stop_codon:yes gene_type:complete
MAAKPIRRTRCHYADRMTDANIVNSCEAAATDTAAST